jgi:hypothetical protein
MPVWFHHFAHLWWRAFVCAYTFLGTSPGGLAAQIVSLLTTEAQGGWWKCSTWRTNWRGALKRGFYTLAVVWAVTFAVCIVTTVYDDHRALSDRLRTVVNENHELKTQLQNRDSPPSLSLNPATKREIQQRFSLLIRDGNRIRDEWQAFMTEHSTARLDQTPYANKARQWHVTIKQYLRTIPEGTSYIARLNAAARTACEGWPLGVDYNTCADLARLSADLGMLGEFIKDPDLGKP